MEEESRPQKVYELLGVPGRWTRGASARDIHGRHVTPNESRACKWCLFGALVHVYGGSPSTLDPLIQRITPRINTSIPAWNDADGRTQEEVHALALELDI